MVANNSLEAYNKLKPELKWQTLRIWLTTAKKANK